MYEGAIIKALNLTIPKYTEIINGSAELNGKTGTDAIVSALSDLDTKKQLKL